MKLKLALVVLSLTTVAACEGPPAVTQFNGYSVTIQKMGYDLQPEDAQDEADRICASAGKSARFESFTLAPQKGFAAPIYNFFYLCV